MVMHVIKQENSSTFHIFFVATVFGVEVFSVKLFASALHMELETMGDGLRMFLAHGWTMMCGISTREHRENHSTVSQDYLNCISLVQLCTNDSMVN